jgi:PAS domain S-box-containing protein
LYVEFTDNGKWTEGVERRRHRQMNGTIDSFHVLHVGDEPDFADTAGALLEREDERFTVTTATSANDGLKILETAGIDCVISDYDMPGQNDTEFLEAVRDTYPDLPFILFTGKGSEEVASEAISVGVSDYLQKSGETDQYTVLANRVANLVEKYRAERARARHHVLIKEATDTILIVDEDGIIQYATPSSERILRRTCEDLVGRCGFDLIHPEDRAHVVEEFTRLVDRTGSYRTVEFRYECPDGSWIWVQAHMGETSPTGPSSMESLSIPEISPSERNETQIYSVRARRWRKRPLVSQYSTPRRRIPLSSMRTSGSRN